MESSTCDMLLCKSQRAVLKRALNYFYPFNTNWKTKFHVEDGGGGPLRNRH